MHKLTFVGGIHPYDGKDLSKDKPIQVCMPGKELAYPLSQHIGAPAGPLVAKGDRVLAGQKIAICLGSHTCLGIRHGKGYRAQACGHR